MGNVSQKGISKFLGKLKPTNNNDVSDINVRSDSNNTGRSGQLLTQCGGHGNLQEIIAILERTIHLEINSNNTLQIGSNHGILLRLRILVSCFKK